MLGWKQAAALSLFMGLAAPVLAADAKPAATPASGITATAAATWESIKGFSVTEKDKAVKAGKQLIADTDKKIADLSKQAKGATGETKKAHEANMAELKEKKKAAQAELAKLGKASGDAWDATKTGFSDAGKALSASYDKAAAAFKK